MDCFDCDNIGHGCKTCVKSSNWKGEQMENVCFLCDQKYPQQSGEATIIGSARDMQADGLRFGVCPTCRKYTEIGRNAENSKMDKEFSEK